MQKGTEGEEMERKCDSRPSSVPPKQNGTDGKRTDNGSTKNPRYNKKREPNNTKPRNGQPSSRRPMPPKSRGYDKRPRSRGYYNYGQREEVTKEGRADAEIGSALRPGSKKGNLNHLLNFTFAPRESDTQGGYFQGSSLGRGRHGRSGLKFNKEHFLQANCQFVVKESGDYRRHEASPDILVDWDLIEQVRIFNHGVPSCPICLYPPTAAKLTRCGHIYCWVCILHYLSLGEKSWRKCPICYEAVHQKDLKSVVSLEAHPFKVGEKITMKLMRREKGTIVPMPRGQWKPREGKPCNLEEDVDIQYAKLLCARPEQVQTIIRGERLALEQQLREEGKDSLEGSYVQSALDLLKVREDALSIRQDVNEEVSGMMESLQVTGKDEGADENPEGQDTNNGTKKCNQDIVEYASAFDDEIVSKSEEDSEESASPVADSPPGAVASEEEAQEEAAGVTSVHLTTEEGDIEAEVPIEEAVEELAMPAEIDEIDPPRDKQQTDTLKPPGNAYYFYQAADGQNIYLHSINARTLIKEYGSWENCPDTISASIVELEGFTMKEELRKRLRYLSHLPLTCEFRVTELALKPPTVSEDTLKSFSGEIERRQKQRQRKMREEKRISRKMKAVEDRQKGLYPGLSVKLSSAEHFPTYDRDRTTSGSSQASNNRARTVSGSSQVSVGTTSSEDSQHSTPSLSPGGLNPEAAEFVPTSPRNQQVSGEGSQPTAMSFAQMLVAGKAKPQEAWPKLTKPAEAWPRQARSPDSESDNEDRVPVPTYQASFGDAIQEALDSYGKKQNEPHIDVSTGGEGKKKKGKKKKVPTATLR